MACFVSYIYILCGTASRCYFPLVNSHFPPGFLQGRVVLVTQTLALKLAFAHILVTLSGKSAVQSYFCFLRRCFQGKVRRQSGDVDAVCLAALAVHPVATVLSCIRYYIISISQPLFPPHCCFLCSTYSSSWQFVVLLRRVILPQS